MNAPSYEKQPCCCYLGGGRRLKVQHLEAGVAGSRKIGSGVFGEAHFSDGAPSLSSREGDYPPCPITQNATAPNTAAVTVISNETARTERKAKNAPADMVDCSVSQARSKMLAIDWA
jgi:hypothetical protein